MLCPPGRRRPPARPGKGCRRRVQPRCPPAPGGVWGQGQFPPGSGAPPRCTAPAEAATPEPAARAGRGPGGGGRAAVVTKTMENKLISAASAYAAGSIPERESPVEGSPGGSGRGEPAAAGPGDALYETTEAAVASLAGTSNI